MAASVLSVGGFFVFVGDVVTPFWRACSQTEGEHNETIYNLSVDCIGGSIPFAARS
jgi:hypothetical protein